MTRAAALIAVAKVLSPVGTPPIPLVYAEQVLLALDDALTLEPEIAEMSATLIANADILR